MKTLRERAKEANVPLIETKGKVILGYVGQPKGAAQIVCKQGFINLEGKLPNGNKITMSGTKEIDPLTGGISYTKEIRAISMLKSCEDF